jgi:hypothetical protein
MALNQNKRLFWAVEAIGFAPDGSSTFVPAHGVQSLGSNLTFNLTEVFELGQISIYDNVEDTPDIEFTIEKLIDGYPLIYHLATPNAASPSLVGRSTERCIMALSTFGDTQNSASGTPNTQMTASGLYVSSMAYSFPAEDNATESITLVGNNKVWASGSFTFTGGFNNNDTPASGIMRRQHVVMGTTSGVASVWPKNIPGINANGYNPQRADGTSYSARIQNVSISTDLGREQLVELGRRNPFFRYATFPVEVTCDIEVLSVDGDFVSATEAGIYGNGNNLSNEQIILRSVWGDVWDLGNKNKLSSVSSNMSTDGSNQVDTFSFSNFNDLTILSESDPAGL